MCTCVYAAMTVVAVVVAVVAMVTVLVKER
jgi:hypothetical protein